ncbi:hypothetical protein [Singulisphaera sp. PoT]|uniref:hypothetical protein n=1 Tax=Singulisphaera sp. PoT TaxID=3411797 RepID=UPI003BF4FB1B
MNKLIRPLAIAAGLTLGLATSFVRADTIQSLSIADLSASQFNNDFKAIDNAPAITSAFTYAGSSGTSGLVTSQVFQGVGSEAGLYAYAFQYKLNDTTASAGPVDLRATATPFNSTPIGTDLTGSGSTNYVYAISDNGIGGIGAPSGANGQGILKPTNVYWSPNATNGSLLTTYFDPASAVSSLKAGATSATFVVLSKQPFTTGNVAILGSAPIDPGSALTTTYTTTPGKIDPIPVPEPTTVLAWTGMLGAAALVRRIRKNRAVVA